MNTYLNPGENEIDVKSINPGIYFAQINLNNKTVVKKIVIER
jgi:hypothetical protein